MANKTSDTTFEQQRQAIIDMLEYGLSRSDVVAQLENNFSVPTSTAYRWIEKAALTDQQALKNTAAKKLKNLLDVTSPDDPLFVKYLELSLTFKS